MRTFALVAVSCFVASGCKDKKPAEQTPAATTPEPPRDVRAPLVRPGANAPAIDDAYTKAKRVALGVLAPRAHTADAILVVARDWTKASAPLRSLGRDARSGEVATLVAAGAASRDGAVPGGSAEEWAAVGAVAAAYAAERDQAGESADAVWQLLAATRMGYDIARDRPGPEAKHGLNLVDGALAALQAIAQRAGADALPDDELTAALAACRRQMTGTPADPGPTDDEPGGGGKWTDGEWSFRYRRSSATLSATCFILARVLERRGVEVAGDPILDPISGAPWQVADGMVRGGELEHQGARVRLEFPLVEGP